MDDIILEHTFPYSVEQVWEAITDKDAVSDWLSPADFRAVVGHKFEFGCSSPETQGYDGIIKIEILEVAKPRRLSYSWKTSDMHTPTTVTYILTSKGSGTHLRLEHTGFVGDNGKFSGPMFKGGWPTKIKDLAAYVEKKARKGATHA